ncbi:unnamed protein product [Caenorhabditis auriculariae]|uniref:DNA mismatch repair proteins mutS family domain-containing protein n=1 Tax=Caenorhabditis auriculariae TaxID=2777116 RepID=A0A8S1GUU9_9PELO|nr:unnamed protein product [Caenorhabditis auriculariae]
MSTRRKDNSVPLPTEGGSRIYSDDRPIFDDPEDRRIICINLSAGSVGAAFYDQATKLLHVMNDVDEDNCYRITDSLIKQVEPTEIVVNNSNQLQFLNFLGKKYGHIEILPPELRLCAVDVVSNPTNEGSSEEQREHESSENDEDDSDPPPPQYGETQDEGEGEDGDEVEMENNDDDFDEDWFGDEKGPKLVFNQLNNSFFHYEKALKRIAELFDSERSRSSTEASLSVRFRVSPFSTNMTRAVGALLYYLEAIRLGVENRPLNVRAPIEGVKTFVLESLVEMDWNTYQALEIFPPKEKKSKNPTRGGADKSLFSLCNKTKSCEGKRLLGKWFRTPTKNREVLRKRQAAIAYFAHDCNLNTTYFISRTFSRVKNIKQTLNQLRTGHARFLHWKAFSDTIEALIHVGKVIHEREVKLDIIEKKIDLEVLNELAVLFENVIDYEASASEDRVVVNRGVDQALDECKDVYEGLPKILTEVAQEESIKLGLENTKCCCIYVPILGYMLVLPIDFPIDERFRMVYTTNTTMHVKNERMDRLDQEMGDIKMQIVDKEALIQMRVKKLIMAVKNELHSAVRVVATLDAIISLSLVSREMNWVCPALVDELVIFVNEGTHPLSQLVSKKNFVPNPISSWNGESKVKIITGPNACGKSIYLKQVGIIVFLASIGSFVPARKAKIGPIDLIITRMYTIDTVLDGLSTFALDIGQISVALRRSTGKSLVIIDEFGKGTMVEVGLSLLAACLTYWIQRGVEDCPHLFLSSHFHALPKYIPYTETFVSFHTLTKNLPLADNEDDCDTPDESTITFMFVCA